MSKPTGFVIRVLPADAQKGRLAKAVLQTNSGPEILQIEAPHIITTGKISQEEADSVKQQLGAYPFSEFGLNAVTEPYAGGDGKVLQVRGDRDKLKEVVRKRKDLFREISVLEWLKYFTNFPFADVADGRFTGKRATLEEVLAAGDCALDIETNKEVEKEEELADPDQLYTEINTAVFSHRDAEIIKSEIVTSLNSGENRIGSAQIHLAEQKQISSALDDIIRQQRKSNNILWMHTFNGMSFDLFNLREMEDEFTPAQDGSEPKITAHIGNFSKRVEIKDFIVLDYYAFARQFLPFLPEKNLEAVCKFTGVKFAKTLNYDKLARLIFRAQHGDGPAAREVLVYGCGDTEVLFALGDIFKPAITRLAFNLETSPEAVCATSKKQNAFKLWARRDFFGTNALAAEYMTNNFRDFDFYEEKLEMAGLEKECKPELGLKKGNFYAVYLNTLATAFSFAKKELLAGASKNSKGPERICYLQALDSICEKPLFDLNTRMPDKVFFAKYGQSKENTDKRLAEEIGNAKKFLEANALKIVNYSKHVVMLEGPPGLEAAIENSENFALLGTSQVLLGFGAKEFLTQIGGAFVGSGMSVSGKRGDRTRFERKAIPHILKQAVMEGSYDAPLQYVYKSIARPLAYGTIDRHLLVFEKKITRAVGELAIQAHGRKSVEAQKSLGTEVGKTNKWGYVGKGKIVTEEVFVQSQAEIDVKFYKKHIFGADSPLYKMLSSLYNPAGEKSRRLALKHVLDGRPDRDDWRTLGVSPPLALGQQTLFANG
ncbi:MAG: hypothetical protein HY438_01030 [DPANN group archaeon]|nr:hypothetical protein [DPANN group archaeon]